MELTTYCRYCVAITAEYQVIVTGMSSPAPEYLETYFSFVYHSRPMFLAMGPNASWICGDGENAVPTP
jgi:hypothetical protein